MQHDPHSCGAKPGTALPRPSKVSVNGIAIPRDEIARETQNHTAKTPIDAWKAAARALVIRELLLQEARRRAIPAEPLVDGDRRETQDEAEIRTLIETAVVVPEPREQECLRYYEQNLAKLRSSDLWEAAHILLPVKPGDAAGLASAKLEAEMLIAELGKAPQRFGELARRYSQCSSSKEGGALGQISEGSTVPEFETALHAMREGDISPVPVVSRFGLHIIRLDRHILGRLIPFSLAQERIADYLGEAVRRRATAQYIAKLVTAAEIAGIEMPGAAEHNVQ